MQVRSEVKRLREAKRKAQAAAEEVRVKILFDVFAELLAGVWIGIYR